MSTIPISVCIIAKNEEKNIERCLSSLAPYGFEIVVVDTGSTDRTKELAAKYTDRIYDFEWVNDFSAARNFSLEKASNNWIFMMDCDEWIESIDLEEMDYFRKHLSDTAGSVVRRSTTGTPEKTSLSTDYTERLFSRKNYHYTGIIHEQLTPKHGGEIKVLILNTVIGHSGYCMTEEERNAKSMRNAELLLKQLESDPHNPYVYYQLGKSYQIIDDHEQACYYFEKALGFNIDPKLLYVQDLIVHYGYELLENNQKEKALALQAVYEDFSSNADFVYMMGLIYRDNMMYKEALQEFLKALNFDFCIADGVNSYRSYYQIGCILKQAGEKEKACDYFRLCGDYSPALYELSQLEQA